MARRDGRQPGDIRPVVIEPGFHRLSEGSCLYRAGGTVVLCTASIEPGVPAFLEGKGKGWLTAEYQMHPRINPVRREPRDGRGKALSGRTQEIQRLIGRALRAAVHLDRLGPKTIALDCDVLEADGGTRTASVTGAFVALALALHKLRARGEIGDGVLRCQVAAVSAGLFDNERLLDLDYSEDSRARVDLNLVATAGGGLIEVQGTAEGEPVARPEMDLLIDLAMAGVQALCRVQAAALEAASAPLSALGLPDPAPPASLGARASAP